MHHLLHRRYQLGLCGQPQAQGNRQRQHPLAHWHMGMTLSTRCAAACAMRLAPHEGQKPRRLQLKATSLSWPQSPQRRRSKPWARDVAFEEGVELVFDELRQVGPGGHL